MSQAIGEIIKAGIVIIWIAALAILIGGAVLLLAPSNPGYIVQYNGVVNESNDTVYFDGELSMSAYQSAHSYKKTRFCMYSKNGSLLGVHRIGTIYGGIDANNREINFSLSPAPHYVIIRSLEFWMSGQKIGRIEYFIYKNGKYSEDTVEDPSKYPVNRVRRVC